MLSITSDLTRPGVFAYAVFSGEPRATAVAVGFPLNINPVASASTIATMSCKGGRVMGQTSIDAPSPRSSVPHRGGRYKREQIDARLPGPRRADRSATPACILLFLIGGPSQLDTWDLKPAAPGRVRGPFQPIATNVPGMQICEHFPRMAQLARHYAIVRSVHHTAAPIHETGHQLMQTGRLVPPGEEHPHYGAVLSHLRGARQPACRPFVLLPGPIGSTGVSISHGQGGRRAGPRSRACRTPAQVSSHRGSRTTAAQALDRAPAKRRSRPRAGYGHAIAFGQSCLLARRLVEDGVRW